MEIHVTGILFLIAISDKLISEKITSKVLKQEHVYILQKENKERQDHVPASTCLYMLVV